jgi:hypothetical protein
MRDLAIEFPECLEYEAFSDDAAIVESDRDVD